MSGINRLNDSKIVVIRTFNSWDDKGLRGVIIYTDDGRCLTVIGELEKVEIANFLTREVQEIIYAKEANHGSPARKG